MQLVTAKNVSLYSTQIEMISDDNDDSANSWLPFKPMHGLFTASFKEFYSAHEAVRGSKLVISSLLEAGMIHETMETIFREEMEVHPLGYQDEMKSKFFEILRRNFPKLPSVPIPLDDIANFLVHYCQKTFADPAGVGGGGGGGNDLEDYEEEEEDQAVGDTRGREDKRMKDTNKQQQQVSETSQAANDTQRQRDAAKLQQTDALTICRLKLCTMIPADDASDAFKEFNIRCNSLGVVKKNS